MFSRKEVVDFKHILVDDIVIGVEKMLSRIIGEDIELKIDLAGRKAMVFADAGQMEQVLMNLATNARDAMPSGGTITIATFSQDTGGYGLTPVANRIALRVSDTGAGMDAETVNHIFEPSFTTKQERGAGLGLAIVHGLVQQFGGTISVESVVGRGTTFTLTLPVVADAAVSASRDSTRPLEASPSAILIVEGDTTNRQLLRRLMTDLDRQVLATATAAEALLIAERYSGPIGLAVIDVTIENGRTLARRLRENRAEMKVLLLAQDQPIDVEPGDELLREPFELTDVLSKAKDLL